MLSILQEFFVDGWEEWPDTDFLNDDSAMQNHVLNSINPVRYAPFVYFHSNLGLVIIVIRYVFLLCMFRFP